jgi:hypothetical protein
MWVYIGLRSESDVLYYVSLERYDEMIQLGWHSRNWHTGGSQGPPTLLFYIRTQPTGPWLPELPIE